MSERQYAMPHDLPVAITPLEGTELAMFEQGGQLVQAPYNALTGDVAKHAEKHQLDGDDPIGTLDNIDGGIPYLDTNGMLDSRVSDASTTKKGKVQLATDGEESATKPPASTDSRLKDKRDPTEHAIEHVAGADVIPNATVTVPGLMSATDKVKADATTPAYIPTEDQKAALAGTSGTPGTENKYVTNADGRLPTADQKAALAGSYGTPSDTNRYVTESDPILDELGGGGGNTGPDLIGIGEIGSGLSITTTGDPALAALSTTDVAFVNEANDELRTYRWSGTAWSQQGSGLAIPGVNYPAISALNATDIAFIDETYQELRTYRWSGTAWSLVGTGLSIPGVNYPAISALNATDIAFIDSSNDELRTYRWSGTAWSLVGTGLSIPAFNYPAISALNATDIAFIDSSNDELRTYRWSGTAWSQQGSGLAISGVERLGIAALNSTDIAFIDSNNKELRTYRWSGTAWSRVNGGLDLLSVGTLMAITALSSNDVAFIDNSNDELRFYNFLFGYDSASVNISADYEVPEIDNGKSITVRRTSAYDGNPVTITPPSGATFEGLASIDLYGQYSYVELERISATVFAIKTLEDLDLKVKGVLTSAKAQIANTFIDSGVYLTIQDGFLIRTDILSTTNIMVHLEFTMNTFSGGYPCIGIVQCHPYATESAILQSKYSAIGSAPPYCRIFFTDNVLCFWVPKTTNQQTLHPVLHTHAGPYKIVSTTAASLPASRDREVTANVLLPWSYINDGPNIPSSATSDGTKGQIYCTAGHLYICYDTNSWRRVAVTSF